MTQRRNIRKRPVSSGERQRALSKRTRRRRTGSKRRAALRFVVSTALIAVFLLVATNALSCQVTNSKYAAVEKWRGTVSQACEDCDLGAEWTDAVLAAMYVESGGDEDVTSVEGVSHDIMQAAEGRYGDIVKNGSSTYGVEAQTCEASIYAGTLEFKQNLELWHDYFGSVTPQDNGEIQLVIQGYNFGALGWYHWCTEHGITSYSVEDAQRYSDEEMPEDAKGTPTHAEKWLAAYERIIADSQT